jgi:hypothetical protein
VDTYGLAAIPAGAKACGRRRSHWRGRNCRRSFWHKKNRVFLAMRATHSLPENFAGGRAGFSEIAYVKFNIPVAPLALAF